MIYKLKEVQVFIRSIKNLKYQVKKKVELEINLRNIVLAKYYNILDIFFKKNSDILFLYQKYSHKIILKKK